MPSILRIGSGAFVGFGLGLGVGAGAGNGTEATGFSGRDACSCTSSGKNSVHEPNASRVQVFVARNLPRTDAAEAHSTGRLVHAGLVRTFTFKARQRARRSAIPASAPTVFGVYNIRGCSR